jgi:hypothetical protein
MIRFNFNSQSTKKHTRCGFAACGGALSIRIFVLSKAKTKIRTAFKTACELGKYDEFRSLVALMQSA